MASAPPAASNRTPARTATVPPRRVGGSVTPGTDDFAGSIGTGRSSLGAANSGSGDGGGGVSDGGVHDGSADASPFAARVAAAAALPFRSAAPSLVVSADRVGGGSEGIGGGVAGGVAGAGVAVDAALDGNVAGGGVGESGGARSTRFVSASSALTVGIAFSVGNPGSSMSSIGTSAWSSGPIPARVLCTGIGDNVAPTGGRGVGGAHGCGGGAGGIGGGFVAVTGDVIPVAAGGSVTAANAPVRRSRGAASRRTVADKSARARSMRPPRTP